MYMQVDGIWFATFGDGQESSWEETEKEQVHFASENNYCHKEDSVYNCYKKDTIFCSMFNENKDNRLQSCIFNKNEGDRLQSCIKTA